MEINKKILFNALGAGAIAVTSFVLGRVTMHAKDKKLQKNDSAKAAEQYKQAVKLNELTQKAWEEVKQKEEIVNVKYSFCRCIAENMEANGYTINFMPERANSFDISPAVEKEQAYSVAITTIGDSTMDSYHKQLAIAAVKKEQDSEYYKAVIGVANSKVMSSTDKLSIIKDL